LFLLQNSLKRAAGWGLALTPCEGYNTEWD